MNYTELVAAICSYAENYEQDFVANIPLFVQQTEQRVFNTTQMPAIRSNKTNFVTQANKYLTLPTDYLATFSLAVINPDTQTQDFLLHKDVNFIREAYPNPNTTGTPKHYAQFDEDTFILGPSPDRRYQVELHYYAYPESIVTAETSWLGENFDSVLLYGALVEAAVFMRQEQDMVTYYKTQYDQALELLKILGDGKDRRDAYRSGQVRLPVN
jgi:hypothetical protein